MKLAVALSSRGNDIYINLVPFLIDIARRYNHTICVGVCNFSAEAAQRLMFQKLYTVPDWDYCLFVDSDIGPPAKAIDKLIEADKDIIGIPVWHCVLDDVHLNVHYDEKLRLVHKEKEGIEEVFFISFAFLLIKRGVFDELRKVDTVENPLDWSPMIDERWKQSPGQDHVLAAKFRKLGFKSYINWDIKGTIHYKTVPLCGKLIENIRGKEERGNAFMRIVEKKE